MSVIKPALDPKTVEVVSRSGYPEPFRARVESEIPLGGGLGSSAALGVALARAFKPGVSAADAARLAMRLETVLRVGRHVRVPAIADISKRDV